LTKDISKKTVLIMVIIAIIVSVVSTSIVLNAVYNYVPESGLQGAPVGRATLTVPPQPPSGQVVFTVTNPKEEKK
jgi:hypothetical protein